MYVVVDEPGHGDIIYGPFLTEEDGIRWAVKEDFETFCVRPINRPNYGVTIEGEFNVKAPEERKV